MDEVENLGYGDNTLVMYIWGDNGTSAEGQNGTISEMLAQNGIPTKVTSNTSRPSMPWADSTCSVRPRPTTVLTPAGPGPAAHPTRGPSSSRRTSAARAIRWPSAGRRGSSPTHAASPVPSRQRRRPHPLRNPGHHPAARRQRNPAGPIDGVSFAYTFNDAKAKGRDAHCNTSRSWAAAPSTTTGGSRLPLDPHPVGDRRAEGNREWTPDNDKWELYNLEDDWSQANDLAETMPEKLADMKELFAIEFAKNRLSNWRRPVDGLPPPEDRAAPRRPNGLSRAGSPACRSSAPRRSATSRTSSRSTPSSRQTPTACSTRSEASPAASPVRAERRPLLRVQPVRDGANPRPAPNETLPRQGPNRSGNLLRRTPPGRPARDLIKANGSEAASASYPSPRRSLFTANECLDIGTNLGSPVSVDYYDQAPFKFNGEIEKVQDQVLCQGQPVLLWHGLLTVPQQAGEAFRDGRCRVPAGHRARCGFCPESGRARPHSLDTERRPMKTSRLAKLVLGVGRRRPDGPGRMRRSSPHQHRHRHARQGGGREGVSRKPPYSPYAGRNFPTRPSSATRTCTLRFRWTLVRSAAGSVQRTLIVLPRARRSSRRVGSERKLSRPLDFLVVTDHSDGMGFFPQLMAAILRCSARRRDGNGMTRSIPAKARKPRSISSPVSARASCRKASRPGHARLSQRLARDDQGGGRGERAGPLHRVHRL